MRENLIPHIQRQFEETVADYLYENGVISENFYNFDLENGSEILAESKKGNKAEFYQGRVGYDLFKSIWLDVENFPTMRDVGEAIASPGSSQKTIQNAPREALRHFYKWRPASREELPEDRRVLMPAFDDSPSTHVFPGKRGGRSTTGNIEKINNTDLLPGELYADMSRIQPRRWFSWLKFWERKTRVNPPQSTIGALIKRWRMFFILGYELERGLFFEVWYNSMESTFSVHDKNGNTVRSGMDLTTAKQAIDVLFNHVAQMAPDDALYLSDIRKQDKYGIAKAVATETEKRENEAKQKAIQDQKKRDMDEKRKQKKLMNDYMKDPLTDEDFEAAQRSADAWTANSRNEPIGGSTKERDSEASEKKKSEDELKWDHIRKQARDRVRSHETFGADRRKEIQQREKKQRDEWDKSEEQLSAARKAALERAKNERRNFRRVRSEIEKDVRATSELDFDFKAVTPEQVKNLLTLFNARLRRLKRAEQQFANIQKQMARLSPEELYKEDVDFINKTKVEIKRLERAIYMLSRDASRTMNETVIPSPKLIEDGIITESLEDLLKDIDEESMDVDDNPLDKKQFDRLVDQTRKTLRGSSYTRQAVSSKILGDMVQQYEKTRIRGSKWGNVWRNILGFFRGRSAKIERPTDYSRLETIGKIFGKQIRADFIIGFTINDRVNIEIWYMQTIDPANSRNTISSFFVYDVTAETVIKAHIPYYRHALQMVFNKIGTPVTV